MAQERGKVREGARRQLRVGHVVKPFGKKGRHVSVVRRRADEDLGVAQPPEPLVALGAIGRDAKEIVPLGPVDIGIKPVDISRRALEGPRARRVRTDRTGGYRTRAQLARQARDLRVPEAVDGEARLQDLLPAGGGVRIGLAGCAQVVDVQAAVGVQGLAVTDADVGALRLVDDEPAPARQVLAEIDHELVRGARTMLCQGRASHTRTGGPGSATSKA